jgi:hypothetical protein
MAVTAQDSSNPLASQEADVVGPEVIGTVVDDPVITGTDPAPGTVIINNIPDSNSSDNASDNESAPASPIYYVIVGVLALLLVGAMVYNSQIVKFLATMVPPETAASIFQAGFRFGIQTALNEAVKTPTEADDDFFKKLAADRGLIVNRLGSGAYEVIYAEPPTPSGAAG